MTSIIRTGPYAQHPSGPLSARGPGLAPPRVLVVVNQLREPDNVDTKFSARELLMSYGCVYAALRRVSECGMSETIVAATIMLIGLVSVQRIGS